MTDSNHQQLGKTHAAKNNTLCEIIKELADGLPANLFYSTGIPVCILVLKKCKKPDDVLFINAAEHFDKGKRQNVLAEKHIDKIIETYQCRREEPRYSRRISMADIAANDFNLNISRYISTAVQEEEIDLAATHRDLMTLDAQTGFCRRGMLARPPVANVHRDMHIRSDYN